MFPFVVQLLSHVWLCDPVDCSTPGFLSFTVSQGLLRLMSIESVMPSNLLILCCHLLLLPSIFPSLIVFSSESALCIRWLKYWNFNFSICSLILHLFTPILIICKCWCIAVVSRTWLVTGTLWYSGESTELRDRWCGIGQQASWPCWVSTFSSVAWQFCPS